MNPPLIVRAFPFVLVILGAIGHWLMPRLTRHDLYFAVTVPPGFRDSGQARLILRRYRRGVISVSTLALVLLGAAIDSHAFLWVPLIVLTQLGALFGIFYATRRAVLPNRVSPTTVREAHIGPRARKIPGGWMVASGPYALLAASAAYLGTHWRLIPARFVVHWGAGGLPDRWATRSPMTVFLPLLMAALILAGLTLLLYGIAHWLRPIHADGAEGARESRFRTAQSILLLTVEYCVALQFSWIALHPLLSGPQRPAAIIALLPAMIVFVFVGVLMWLGQGGSRTLVSQSTTPESAKPIGDRTEDRFWKLGVFYFNRDDPSVMVEKRFGIGYTMNFAHPMAWVLIAILVLIPVAVSASIALRHVRR